jgi:hypothetical protein
VRADWEIEWHFHFLPFLFFPMSLFLSRFADAGFCLGLRRRARRVGVDAFLVKEKDAGAEAKQHDGDPGDDAKTGYGRGRTLVTAPDDDVAGDGDDQFQNATPKQPSRNACGNSGGIAQEKAKEDSPEDPEDAENNERIHRRLFKKLIAASGNSDGTNHRNSEKRGQQGCNGNREQNMGAGLETFLRRVHGQEEQESLAAYDDGYENPQEPLAISGD